MNSELATHASSPKSLREWIADHSVLLIVITLAVIPFVSPYEALATQMIIWGLLALGYNILYGYTGLLSFGHAAYFGLGAYATGIVLIRTHCSLLAGIGAGVLASCIGAVVIGFFCLRRRGIYFALLTMAFAQMLYFTASIWESLTGGEPGLRNIPTPPLEIPGVFSLNIYTPMRFYFFVWFFVAVSLLVLNRVLDSPFGRVLQGIRENEKRARAIGYNTNRIRFFSFVLSGTFSGLAGALHTLYIHFVGLEQLYWETSGKILLMTLLGGPGTFFGPFIGAGLFLYLEDLISGFTQYWMIVLGPIFVLCVLFFPQGIWGTVRDAAEKSRTAR
ncbi:MAG TPA: branched-chain amino acid ABC transporter permease [Thermodesulfobacteriota bacterium]|nr:branched-chain amino acid ABC transporter permease [Thermodesulfobacteriota bacterium]